MGQGKGAHLKIPEVEGRARFKNLPIRAFAEFGLHRIGGITVCKDREIGATGEPPYPLRMVAVLVGEENRLNLIDGFAEGFKFRLNTFSAETGID